MAIIQPICPVCGGETDKASLHVPFSYWRCRVCSSSHLHPQPSPGDMKGFYDGFHLPAEQGGQFAEFEERTSQDFPVKAAIVTRHLEKGRRGHQADMRVLDIGCGKGFFVRDLSRLGLSVEGIDLSEVAVKEGTDRLGIQGLRSGKVGEQEDWDRCFDAVTIWATIEHLPSPGEFLKSLRKVLRPSGLLFMDTGLGGDFLDRCAPGLLQWYDPPQHLFVFSRSGMEMVLRDAGYSILHCDVNFERSQIRRMMKLVRNVLLVVAGSVLFRVALGEHTFKRMRMETKMPFGALMFVVARLNE